MDADISRAFDALEHTVHQQRVRLQLLDKRVAELEKTLTERLSVLQEATDEAAPKQSTKGRLSK